MIQELSVSCAWIDSTPSRVEKRARSASSMRAIGVSGVGRSIRDRPSRLISSSSPISADSTATDSTTTKLVNRTPAANQKVPRSAGNASPSRSRAPIGSVARSEPGSIAATSGNCGSSAMSPGTISRRLIPAPAPMPVTKNAGGPPSGADSAPNRKNEV